MRKIIFIGLVLLFLLQGIHASRKGSVTINADYITLNPGKTGKITIEIENNFDYDLSDVSVALFLSGTPFTPIGSNHKEIDEITEDDSKRVKFTIKAAPNAKPGDYTITYEVAYKNENNSLVKKSGNFGISVSSKPNIDFSVETQNPLLEEKGEITLRIINKGLGKIKFVTVEIFPEGFEVLSDKKVYIGTIESDDDDSAVFNVVFKEKNPKLLALVTYKDFENIQYKKPISLPIKVYTRQQAVELGIVKKSNYFIYLIILVILIFVFVVWRFLRKKKKRRNRIFAEKENNKKIS